MTVIGGRRITAAPCSALLITSLCIFCKTPYHIAVQVPVDFKSNVDLYSPFTSRGWKSSLPAGMPEKGRPSVL